MKKGLRITLNAPFVLAFVGLCFTVTLLGSVTGGKSTQLLFMTYHSSLLSPLTWLRAFTHVLGHSGWAHLIGNMSYILLLGPMLEEKYGSKTLLTVTVVTALATSIFNYIVFPNIALCGASGVVFAFILMSSFTGFKEGEIPLTFILVAVFYIGQQVFEGLTVNDNISNTSHIIGGIVGGFFGYILNVRSGRKRF
ncbi:MAG: rhomboid family intramembrane serine protease [Lachnospiraceae bacterium]|nr:rhomboid family intramembrane serine protease [Lachnospiraceae bacterium]